MKIGFDARMIDWAGVGTYSYNLLNSLRQIDKENKYVLFCDQQSAAQVPAGDNFNRVMVTEKVFSAYHQLFFSLTLSKQSLDVFHSPHFIYPLFVSAPSVVTIHDLIPLVFSSSMPSNIARIYYKRANKKAISRAKLLLAVSEATKRDLQEVFSVPPEKVRVTHNGVGDNFKIIEDQSLLEQVKDRYKIHSKFLLNVGNPKPHKNWTGLVEAFAALGNEFKDYQLVLVGSVDPRFAVATDLIKKLNLEDRVTITGFVSEKDMVLLYNAAETFVFPSFYEGFGIPVLEAMACGTPVVCSNTSSLPEVVGDAALMIDPKDKQSLVKGLEKLLLSNDLQEKLSRKGLDRVKQFSWMQIAEQTLKVYQEIASA